MSLDPYSVGAAVLVSDWRNKHSEICGAWVAVNERMETPRVKFSLEEILKLIPVSGSLTFMEVHWFIRIAEYLAA